ncbi:hypothetical protein UFOVP1419_16 [uncultured Caudovirales phage]|uniref:Uncharacterized protein n=1 Tax=uncultured Caudovirales phage TaxID=2100421 RepID=A0A6J5SD39_9CAUD|nr:hypothetical protein UFOVP1419_16 [uncultured Caudovirales phage]
MICPKCGASGPSMVPVSGLSQPSQLVRQDVTGGTAINGFSCRICGKWLEQEIDPVRGMPMAESRPRYDPGVKTQAFYIAERFFESIVMLRERGASWFAVARLLTKIGHRCQERTLQKYFLKEQSRRGYEQAEET